MGQLNSYPTASTIDAVNDELIIWTNSLSAVQNINRNTFLNLASQPVGLSDSQTLTNKTLTSPTINGATLSGTLSGTYTIGGTPTFPASVTQNTVVQTLTNKTLTSPTINSPTITNATISADTLTGYTTLNSGTIYGIPVTTGVINTAGTINGASLVANSVTNASILTGNLYASKFYNPYKFNVYRNAALTDGNGAYVQIIFDTKVYDTGGNYNTSTGLFTAPVSGFYQFNWVISKSQTANTAFVSSIFVNAETTARAVSNQSYQGATTGGASAAGSAFIQLSANDTVQIKSYGSGGAIQVGLLSTNSTSFSGYLVSAT